MQNAPVSKFKKFLLLLLVPIFTLSFILFILRYTLAVLFMPKEAMRLAIAFDMLSNAVFGGNENETISKRCGKILEDSLGACVLCKFLDIFEKDHCKKVQK